MLKIRPHHILCMKAYIGKGYSEEFNINIKNIINELKYEPQMVEITFGLDSICKKCPFNMEDEVCKSEEKVNTMDLKIREYYGINEEIYSYKDIKELVYSRINESEVDDICGNCEWYNITNCKELILK
ncbi:MAG: DUF1284 domain-containing protein [Terrisporobacter sp.]